MLHPSKKPLWLAKLAVLALSSVVAILVIELFVRVAGRDHPLLWEPDAQLGWRHIPNAQLHWTEEGDGHVRINSLGSRDAERSISKEPGVFRIAVFGDSTTEAVQVDLEQTFTQLLEQRFHQRGLRIEVLNFGVSGYGPLQQYLLYSEHVRAFKPDLVLAAVFLDNDVADGDRRLAAGQRGAPFLKPAAAGDFEIDYSSAVSSFQNYHRQPLYTIRRLSAIYRMVSAGRQKRLGGSEAEAGLQASGQVPKRFLLYQDPLPHEWQEAWATFERIITRFAEAVARDGARFAVVSMPAGQVVHPDVWEQLVTDYPAMSSRKWDLRSAEHRLRQIADRHHLALITPLDAFVSAASGAPLFFQGIGHLTPRGHELLAQTLDAALAEHDLVSDIRSAGWQ